MLKLKLDSKMTWLVHHSSFQIEWLRWSKWRIFWCENLYRKCRCTCSRITEIVVILLQAIVGYYRCWRCYFCRFSSCFCYCYFVVVAATAIALGISVVAAAFITRLAFATYSNLHIISIIHGKTSFECNNSTGCRFARNKCTKCTLAAIFGWLFSSLCYIFYWWMLPFSLKW